MGRDLLRECQTFLEAPTYRPCGCCLCKTIHLARAITRAQDSDRLMEASPDSTWAFSSFWCLMLPTPTVQTFAARACPILQVVL